MADRVTRSEEEAPLPPPLDDTRGGPPGFSSSRDAVVLVTPVRATPTASQAVAVPYDVPAVRMFLHPSGTTVAVYPLSREELGEVWVRPEQLAEWNLVTLPNLFVGAERIFQQLVDYPFEYLQVLVTVLRTQQFINGTPLTPALWSQACKRQSTMMSVDKTCAACDMVRTFAMRTLFTAPSRLPEWKCLQFGFECNVESDEPVVTVAPERWIPSPATSPAATLTLPKRERMGLGTSVPAPVHMTVPGANAAPSPNIPESFRIDTLPALPDPTSLRGQDGEFPSPNVAPSDRGRQSVLSGSPPTITTTYLTWSQIPAERRTAQQTTSLITHGATALRRATPSHYMVGDPLLTMTQPDPTEAQVAEYAKDVHSPTWRGLRRDLDKWITTRKAALFEAKGTPLEITNWDHMMGTFFADHVITNPIFQARLAAQTFRGQALFWWRAHSAVLPELVVTFEQLLEWVRAELVPMADPGTAVLSWRQLRFIGDVDDYLQQLDQLSTHFPLPHETLLAMSAEPLGSEAISAVYKADQMYGPGGIPYARLRKFL